MSATDRTAGGVLFLSGDLMFASRVRAAAQSRGLDFQLSGALPPGDLSSLRYVIIDLSTRSGLLPEIGQQCAQRCPDARTMAYGPHVQHEKLSAAREAGIDVVLTNNQFHQQLETWFE